MAKRPRHQNRHIEDVLQYAEGLGWIVEKSNARAHAWGKLYCPHHVQGSCHPTVNGTPRNPEQFARYLRKVIDSCPH